MSKREEMYWDVEVKVNLRGKEYAGLYRIEAIKRYAAVTEALEKLIKENDLKDDHKITLRPYQLLGPYRTLCEVRTKCSVDGRVVAR